MNTQVPSDGGPTRDPEVVALCGGVGGAKLALGLSHILEGERLMIVANTGDDFEHLGLHISPDVDTVLYTLADLANPETGWGRRDETWSFMDALAQLGGETWFNLGDRDLATHVERTWRLRAGETLSEIVADFARKFGIAARILPMSDDPVRTRVETDEGTLAFQRYFVGLKCGPAVRGLSYEGAERATANPALMRALASPDLRAVVICPSNPYLSVAPILSLPGVREALANATAPVIAVSPIVGGRAIKGPTAKIMGELGVDASAASVAAYYAGIIDGFVLDNRDLEIAGSLPVRAMVTDAVMQDLSDREMLARVVLDFADRLASARSRSGNGGVAQ
ncbi:2-phospho-L-lactate transferase [Ferruginivarius sediminum]|uniref:2-phospho-L-lactate transferase n=1 Tax=Ferruginivarius sediminum TaxID=2661937 RepID=A0A369T4Z0_9PROT|nr:2-phospho-L-lactate transferase [Ferruginivarius sediminum]RDD60411.1 2-phospho-L-lactate transferase [Ferruginivarius sediminum]